MAHRSFFASIDLTQWRLHLGVDRVTIRDLLSVVLARVDGLCNCALDVSNSLGVI